MTGSTFLTGTSRDHPLYELLFFFPPSKFCEGDCSLISRLKAFEAKLEQYRQKEAVLPKLPTDSAELFAKAVERLESLLGDPDLVHQANEYMTEFIQHIELRPDTKSLNGLAAEIYIDLGSLLMAGGVEPAIADLFNDKAQLSVRQGALPPRPCGLTPEVFSSA
ncbi:hypothetical protein HCZ30_01720 [Marivivens donghaensis]|uniref:Uncharacterized protein n=1 Tax=Marivivens donghaensis TaxID=1699413 RepID=A0ABX0VV80_9RHOB|nr:hypothetical protein [Marivivens donghaensis]NIY71146.1 hypothetical protein [Marivivens donghaensis]